jgi:hypothetical protein
MRTAISIINAAYKKGCTDNAATNRDMIAKALGTKKLLVPEILDPKIQKAHIENISATIKRSLSVMTKFLPRIENVEEISSDKGPRGNTFSILKVKATRAKIVLIPPPIINEITRLVLVKKSINEKTKGIPIQIIGALKQFLLLLVE